MFGINKKASYPYLRFSMALLLCLFCVASSSDDGWCDSDDDSSHGTITVQNHTTVKVAVVISGPTSRSFDLTGGYQRSETCDTGSYTVTGTVNQPSSPWHGQQIYSRSFSLSEGETETCAMDI